jgi:hypothetical protein
LARIRGLLAAAGFSIAAAIAALIAARIALLIALRGVRSGLALGARLTVVAVLLGRLLRAGFRSSRLASLVAGGRATLGFVVRAVGGRWRFAIAFRSLLGSRGVVLRRAIGVLAVRCRFTAASLALARVLVVGALLLLLGLGARAFAAAFLRLIASASCSPAEEMGSDAAPWSPPDWPPSPGCCEALWFWEPSPLSLF